MTISNLAKLNRTNGGHFFDRDTLKSRQEKLKDFKIVSQNERSLILERNDGARWNFNVKTGRVVHSVEFQAELENTLVAA